MNPENNDTADSFKIIQALPSAVQVINPDGWTIAASDALLDLFSVERELLVGIGAHNFFNDGELLKTGLINAVKEVFAGKQPNLTMVEVPGTDGEPVLLKTRIFPVYDDHHVQYVGIQFDKVGDSISLQRELIAKNDELESFIHTVSHDLKSPLSVIGQCINMLEEEELGNELVDRQILMIRRNSSRMRAFIDRILQLSRVGRHTDDEAYDTPLAVFARSVFKEVSAGFPDVKHTVDIEELPRANIYPDDVAHIFQNLFSNAFKYRDPERPFSIRVSSKETGDFHTIAVSDTGSGIDKEDQSKVFEVFYRGSKEDLDTGTGVGLAIVKRAVEKAGGRIWLESEVGAGTTVYFTVPKA